MIFKNDFSDHRNSILRDLDRAVAVHYYRRK
jgi:hypothetical protein